MAAIGRTERKAVGQWHYWGRQVTPVLDAVEHAHLVLPLLAVIQCLMQPISLGVSRQCRPLRLTKLISLNTCRTSTWGLLWLLEKLLSLLAEPASHRDQPINEFRAYRGNRKERLLQFEAISDYSNVSLHLIIHLSEESVQ